VPEDINTLQTPALPDRRGLIIRGLAWNSLFQVFLAFTSFGSMLVLVRLLSPAEYGRATAATGLLALINCFNCSCCISQAIQLGDNQEPDWTSHWRTGWCIQLILFLFSNAVAVSALLLPSYRPIAPLLSVASIGLLIDCPNQIAITLLRREMNFRTLRTIHAVATLLTALSAIVLAFAGVGAYALIISSNVLHGLPFGLYLMLVRRWRPRSESTMWPDWRAYRAPLLWGAQSSSSAVLTAGRGVLESIVLPVMLGYAAVGLLNRAQVLFSTTAGRVSSLVLETVYPLLPRSASDREQFARHATLFVQTMLFISIPGAVFVGLEGPYLSRLLYGSKWIAADPLIWPGTLFALAASTVLIFATVLQAQNRLRLAFLSSLIAASLCLPAIGMALVGGTTQSYIWTLAAGQIAAALVVMALASGTLAPGWVENAAMPPIMASLAGAIALLPIHYLVATSSVIVRVGIDAALFFLAVFAVLRVFFSSTLRTIVNRVPGGETLARAMRL
jgi:O-antigen/teichoic acid export membrane protein